MSVHDNVTKDGFRIEGNIEFDGDIRPIESRNHDLGTSEKRFRDIWLSDHLDGTEPRIHFGDFDFTASDVIVGRDASRLAGSALQPGTVDFFLDIWNRPQTLEQFQITDPVATGTLTVNEQSTLNGVVISNTEHGFNVNGTDVSRFSTDLTVTQTTRLSGDIIHGGNITPDITDTLFIGTDANRYKQVYVSERVHVGTDSIDIVDIGTIRDVQNGVYATAGQGALADTAYQEGDNITVNNVSMSGDLRGPEIFYIDPEAIGDNTGKVVILGSLQVDGETTTINSTTITVSSRSILLAEGSDEPTTSNNSGLTIDGTSAKLFYKTSPNSWYSSVPFKINNTNSGSSFEIVQTLSGNNPDDLIVLCDKDSAIKFKIDKNFNLNLSDNLFFNSTTNRLGVGTISPAVGLHVQASDAIMLPRGLTSQRPPATTNAQQGYIRYNTTTSQFEGFGAGNTWGSLGGVMDVDQDTYISPETAPGNDNDVLTFVTSGQTRAVIDSTGNIGVGTTAPSAALHVDALGNKSTLLINKDGQKVVQLGTAASSTSPNTQFPYFGMFHGDQEDELVRLYPTGGASWINGGNVGIGTANPDTKLHIYTGSAGSFTPNTNADDLLVEGDGNTGITIVSPDDKYSGIILSSPSDPTGSIIEYNYDLKTLDIGTATDQGVLRFKSGSFATAMTINSSGDVGVGTTDPGAALDVHSSRGPKLTKFGNDITSQYVVTGMTNHTLTFTCGSYYQAEVVITANQTNHGSSNNIYIRGIWSNNYNNHEWNELENVGSMTSSTLSITNTHNGGTEQNGKLIIQHNYFGASFDRIVVRVTEFFGGAHTYTLT